MHSFLCSSWKFSFLPNGNFIPSLFGSVGSRPGVWGEHSNRERQKVFICINTKGCLRQSLGVTQMWLPFVGQKSGYLCCSNYAIFQGITTVWKRFVSLIQKMFEMGPKQWVSFFTSYAFLVYLQNVFKSYKSMLRASVWHCFGNP